MYQIAAIEWLRQPRRRCGLAVPLGFSAHLATQRTWQESVVHAAELAGREFDALKCVASSYWTWWDDTGTVCVAVAASRNHADLGVEGMAHVSALRL
jgi:hypothetical protein